VRLYQLFYDPVSRPRESDLLGPDQPFKPYPPVHRVRFNAGLRLAVFLGSAFGITVIVMLAGVAWATIWGGVTGDPELAESVFDSLGLGAAAELIGAIGAYLVLVGVLEGRGSPLELGWRRIGGFLKGIALGFFLITVTVGLLALMGCYHVRGFNSGYSPWSDLLMAGLTAGVAEELIFRGALFRILEDTVGTLFSVAASALIFGAVHLSNQDGTWLGAVGIAIGALVLPAVYIATRSLWWPMGVHLAWNVTQGPIWSSPISGTGTGRGMLRVEWTGPEWLTGGLFGIEASVVLMATVGAFSVWLLVMAHRSGNFIPPFWKRHRLLIARAVTAAGPSTTENS
jgi:membrane protease YdiL (CAAX protease family)